jgi:hypothetical protein
LTVFRAILEVLGVIALAAVLSISLEKSFDDLGAQLSEEPPEPLTLPAGCPLAQNYTFREKIIERYQCDNGTGWTIIEHPHGLGPLMVDDETDEEPTG